MKLIMVKKCGVLINMKNAALVWEIHKRDVGHDERKRSVTELFNCVQSHPLPRFQGRLVIIRAHLQYPHMQNLNVNEDQLN